MGKEDEIIERLCKIERYLIGDHGDNGLMGRLGIVETKNKSVQSEITEHKLNHWKAVTLAATISGIIAGLLIKLT